MSLYHKSPALSRRFRLVQASFLQEDGLAFANVLPEERIRRAFAEADAEFAQEEDDVYLLAYNLIRKAMLEAALQTGLSPRELSFATAMQTIGASWMLLACAAEASSSSLISVQLASLAEQTVGNRPNRIEPRAVKRRPQPLGLLTKPRDEARQELLEGTAE